VKDVRASIATSGWLAEEMETKVALIQALIPLGLQADGEVLDAEVTALAGTRYCQTGGQAGVVRWGQQRGSVYLADQKLAIPVPRVRDRAANREVALSFSPPYSLPQYWREWPRLPSTARNILTRPTPSAPRRALVPGEHSFIVRVLRARKAPGRSLLLLHDPASDAGSRVAVSMEACRISTMRLSSGSEMLSGGMRTITLPIGRSKSPLRRASIATR
jgi:hypothetical protein